MDVREVTIGTGERRWRARYRDATGRQVVRQFRRQRDARAWIDAATAAKVGGTLTDSKAGRMTLQELYEEINAERSYAPSTTSMRAVAWRHVPARVRALPLNAIDARVVERVLADVAAPAMRAKLRSILSSLFGQAIAKGYVRVNPAKKPGIRATRAERKADDGREQRFLSGAELQRLLQEIPDRYRALIELMAFIGLRPGEAYAVSAGQLDLHLEAPRLTVDRSITGPTKTGQTRVIPLPAVIADALRDHIAKYRITDNDTPIFGTIDPGNWRRRVFQPASRRAGIIGLRVADLRHTAAAHAIGNGAPVYAVQQLLGHSKASTTLDVYGHLWDESGVDLAARLDASIRRSFALVELPQLPEPTVLPVG